MTGARVELTFENQAQVQRALTMLAAVGRSPEALLKPIGVKLASNTRDRMQAGRDPQGNRFAPLSPAYLPFKRGPSVLVGAGMQGGLMGSITSAVSGDQVAVGSNKVYAAVHQFGATIRPKNPKGLLIFRDARGRAWGAAREVTIPARPYLGLSGEDQDDILDITEGAFQRAMASTSRFTG